MRVLLFVLVGCGRIGIDPLDRDDAASSINSDTQQFCFGTGLVSGCADARLVDIALTTMTIDTDASPMCAASNIDACVIVGTTITIASGETVNGIGARPLVLAAETMIAIGGTLSVASHRNGAIGAGADASACLAGTPPTHGGGSGGGGAGGSFAGKGGSGDSNDGGTGGTAAPADPSPTVVRGGCAGSAGAGATPTSSHGGGATYVIARNTIIIEGAINASGSAGGGATGIDNGGGGGGSGGMIGLDAGIIMLASTSRVFANGGGGGEGSGGGDGSDGSESLDGTRALGGTGTASSGGSGGYGGSGTTLAGANAPNDASASGGGGGGGGGGAGVIKLHGEPMLAGMLSPPPS